MNKHAAVRNFGGFGFSVLFFLSLHNAAVSCCLIYLFLLFLIESLSTAGRWCIFTQALKVMTGLVSQKKKKSREIAAFIQTLRPILHLQHCSGFSAVKGEKDRGEKKTLP